MKTATKLFFFFFAFYSAFIFLQLWWGDTRHASSPSFDQEQSFVIDVNDDVSKRIATILPFSSEFTDPCESQATTTTTACLACNRIFTTSLHLHQRFDIGKHLHCLYSDEQGATFCHINDLIFVAEKSLVVTGGERILDVLGRSELAEHPKYSKGTFLCEDCGDYKSKGRMYVESGRLQHHLGEMLSGFSSLTDNDDDEIEEGELETRTIFFVCRYEYANLYHTMGDWYTLFQAVNHFAKESPRLIIWLDGHASGSLDDAWPTIFGADVHRMSEYNGRRVRFERAIFVPPSYRSSLDAMTGNCRSIPAAKYFASEVVSAFSVSAAAYSDFRDQIDAFPFVSEHRRGRPNIVFIIRSTYLAHPRSDEQKKAERTLKNEAEFMKSMTEQLDANVFGVYMHKLPFRKQMQLIKYTDILVGVHGAGLSHAMFLDPSSSVLVELAGNVSWDLHHFQRICTLVGLLDCIKSFSGETGDIDIQRAINDVQRGVDVWNNKR